VAKNLAMVIAAGRTIVALAITGAPGALAFAPVVHADPMGCTDASQAFK
jgi:hypothetical protein